MINKDNKYKYKYKNEITVGIRYLDSRVSENVFWLEVDELFDWYQGVFELINGKYKLTAFSVSNNKRKYE